MKNNVFDAIIVNRHLPVNDGRGNMMIDTGSPASFHVEKQITIGNDNHMVPTTYMGITTQYLSQKVGCDIVGLLGMDIISQYTMWIDLPMKKPFVAFYKDDALPGLYPIETFSVMEVPGICMEVDGKKTKLLLDTGAHISYINDSYFQDKPIARNCKDFSPLLDAEYEVNMYKLPVNFCKKTLDIEFGSMPLELVDLMNHMNVDGIIGYDLMKEFRIIIDNGYVMIPPQGI